MAEVNEAQRRASQRLNARLPQYPPDTTFIKQNYAMLDHYVHSPTGTKDLALRATPKQAKRFELFTLKRDDITRLLNKGVETIELSKKDPYFRKMAIGHKEKQRQYKLLHPGVQRTDDLLDKLKPTDIKHVDKKDFEAVRGMYKTLDDRYYKARGSLVNQM